MIRQLSAAEPSLMILDLWLGQEDGLDLLREIRTRSDVPIIITTGHRLEEIDRVVGLDAHFRIEDHRLYVRRIERRPGEVRLTRIASPREVDKRRALSFRQPWLQPTARSKRLSASVTQVQHLGTSAAASTSAWRHPRVP